MKNGKEARMLETEMSQLKKEVLEEITGVR